MGLKRGLRHTTGGDGNHIIMIPRSVLPSPAVEDEIMGHTAGSSSALAKHEDRAAIPQPCIIIWNCHNPKVLGLDFFLFQALLNDFG